MKVMLQCQFDRPLESKMKIADGCLQNPFATNQHSSWVDSIVANEPLHVYKQQHDTINDVDKKEVFSVAVPKCKKVSGSPGQIFMRPIQKDISHSSGDTKRNLLVSSELSFLIPLQKYR
jgi:hypothetical protein